MKRLVSLSLIDTHVGVTWVLNCLCRTVQFYPNRSDKTGILRCKVSQHLGSANQHKVYFLDVLWADASYTGMRGSYTHDCAGCFSGCCRFNFVLCWCGNKLCFSCRMSFLGTHDLVAGKCYKTKDDRYLGTYRRAVYLHTVSTGYQSEMSTYSYIFENGTIDIDDDDTRKRFMEVPCESNSSSSSSAAAGAANTSAESRILFLEQQLTLAKAELLKQKVQTRSRVARRRKTRSRRYA